MPQANITYDAPYNHSLIAKLDRVQDEKWAKAGTAYFPSQLGYRLGAFHGEAPRMVGGGSSPLKYNPAGNSPAYPPMALSSGLAVSSGGSFHQGARYAGVDGAIGAGFNPFDWGYNLGHDVIGPALFGKGRARRGRGVGMTHGDPKKMSPDDPFRVRKGGKFNLLGAIKDIGHAIGAPIGAVGQKLVEAELGKAVGLGRKKRGGAVRRPRASSVSSEEIERKVGAGEGGAACGGAKRGRSARAEIVKKIMKEKGMKMIEASKYVKQHNLY